MKKKYDPRGIDFDPYTCWEKGNCDNVEEECFGNPEDEDFEEYLRCGVSSDNECPLMRKVNKHKKK